MLTFFSTLSFKALPTSRNSRQRKELIGMLQTLFTGTTYIFPSFTSKSSIVALLNTINGRMLRDSPAFFSVPFSEIVPLDGVMNVFTLYCES